MDNQTLITVVIPILVLQLILLITALTVLIRAEQTRRPKWMWALIIVFVNIFGPIAFFLFGRKAD
ncbi:MAG TPA: PLD nuclease N-terminal domain-containing protein [Paenibacillus sp.]|uniref:PLD nuclease N-terminal domain-containing protein n=1 Tax=Paenibacillus sp. TaxID=58172 RepID=UPI0028D82EAA|nr:PLD nuclease N-terminal domain-containing protein [Paenibacillus sp.]HUC93039.1 PLD nuclease N-terminal domain-containing protein [Paenibacillus sp.]